MASPHEVKPRVDRGLSARTSGGPGRGGHRSVEALRGASREAGAHGRRPGCRDSLRPRGVLLPQHRKVHFRRRARGICVGRKRDRSDARRRGCFGAPASRLRGILARAAMARPCMVAGLPPKPARGSRIDVGSSPHFLLDFSPLTGGWSYAQGPKVLVRSR